MLDKLFTTYLHLLWLVVILNLAMSGWFKWVFIVFFITLLGVTAYLGYAYYSRLKGLNTATEQADTIPVVTREFSGSILCIEEGGEATEAATLCTRGLFADDEKTYELTGSPEIGLDTFSKGDKVMIRGVLTEGLSPLGLDGLIDVVEIEKAATTSAQQAD